MKITQIKVKQDPSKCLLGLATTLLTLVKGVFAASLQLQVRNEPMCVVLLQAVPCRPEASCSYRLEPGTGLPCLAV